MNYMLLGVIALFVTVQNIFKQKYNDRVKGVVLFFSGLCSFFAMLFFIVINRDWSYRAELLLPSFGFGLSYAAASVCTVMAIRYGSLAKTSLIISCSLLIPSFYGIIFLREPIGWSLVVGTVLLVVALVLTNYQKASAEDEKQGYCLWKWIIFVFFAFVGNGMCSTVQKMEGLKYGDEGKNMFMIVALAMATVMLFGVALLMREERAIMQVSLRRGWWLGASSGIINGLTNALVMLLNARNMPASVMFPVISGGGIVLIFLYATLVRKEKFNPRQVVGFALGVISIVLLNL